MALVLGDLLIPHSGAWYWAPLHFLVHHTLALIAGASIAGVLFEILAHRRVSEEMKRMLVMTPEATLLLSHETRSAWVRQLLHAQIAGGDDLSEAIFAGVVLRFMTEEKFRPELRYDISFAQAPRGGWKLGAIGAQAESYRLLQVDMQYVQHLAGWPAEANVSLLLEGAFDPLDAAFRDSACIFRDCLLLHAPEAAALKAHLSAVFAKKDKQPAIPDVEVVLWIDQELAPCTRVEYQEVGLLRFWYQLPVTRGVPQVKNDVPLRVQLRAPYQADAGHYVIVFGEPTASPWITFRPQPYADPANINVMHFLQGDGRPEVVRSDEAIDVTFPRKAGNRLWVLPRSGLVFQWGVQSPGTATGSTVRTALAEGAADHAVETASGAAPGVHVVTEAEASADGS